MIKSLTTGKIALETTLLVVQRAVVCQNLVTSRAGDAVTRGLRQILHKDQAQFTRSLPAVCVRYVRVRCG